MSDLAEFLLARIAETEQMLEISVDSLEYHGQRLVDARALVAAKAAAERAIVANLGPARDWADQAPMSEQLAANDGPASAYWRGQDWVCRILAVPYADHPDYDERWRL